MNLRFKLSILAVTLITPLISLADTNNNLLTGDKKLACEAILCLSSGTRPNECAPSLKRYFSIDAKKMSDTIKERKSFLQLCPSSSEKGMPNLVNAIANGAGRCDAKQLNKLMMRTKTVQRCHKAGLWGNETVCETVQIKYIEAKKPSYCQAYEQNELTSNVNQVHYEGIPEQNGRWVDK